MDLLTRIENTLAPKWAGDELNMLGPARMVILAEVKSFFAQVGWKVKKATKEHYYIARRPGAPTKIRFELAWNPDIELYAKTPNGGWKILGLIREYVYRDLKKFKTLHDMVEYSKTITTPVIIKKDTLPDPHIFIERTHTRVADGTAMGAGRTHLISDGSWVSLSNQIDSCTLYGVVGLKEDGSITNDLNIVAKPGEQVWFHVDCQSGTGATFDIISDGEVFYPIKRYGKQRVTSELKPKSQVNLALMNKWDKIIVNKAIEIYLLEGKNKK